MKEFPYTSFFSAHIRPVISEDKEPILSKIALAEIEKLIPNIDTAVNSDLLPVSMNSFVANRVNKNGDYVDGETAIAIAKYFVNKPINANHNRNTSLGVILTYGFSEFGTDKLLTEEQAKNLGKSPFNVVLGGVLWRLVNPKLVNFVEECGDYTSEHYMKISASWEVGFGNFGVGILPEGVKNTASANEILDESVVKNYSKSLKANGGDGKWGNDNIYRKILMPALPLGLGLTENPAGDVKGVIIGGEIEGPQLEESEAAEKVKKALNKPFRTPGGPKKFGVYVKNDKGNVVLVRFGDPNMDIKRDNPERRKNFRARHNCDQKKDKTTPGYWSCKMWSKKPVSDIAK